MDRQRTVVIGVLLILAGIGASLSSLGFLAMSMEQLWPLFLILLGLLSAVSGLFRDPRKPDSVSFGVTAVLCGVLFFYVTAGAAEWGDMSWLWPAFPLAAGLGWIASWFVDLRKVSNITAGLIGIGVGVVGFLYTSDRLTGGQGRTILSWWPLILVVLGLGLIAQFLVQRR